MNQDYKPNQQQQGNAWNPPMGNMPQQYPGGGLASYQMNYALWGDRVLAALIDGGIAFAFMIVLYIVLLILTMVLGTVVSAISPELGGLLSCGGCLLWFILPPLSYFIIGLLNKTFWVSSRGYSIGQGVMKLKVVDKNGSLISTGQAFLRLFCTVVILYTIVGGLLDLLFPLFDDSTRQTLHDRAVGTYVIKTA